MREFGVSVHVKISDLSRYGGKHQNVPRVFEGVFLGYSAFGPNCYRIYDLTNKVVRDNVPRAYCTTFDDVFPFRDETLWPAGEILHRDFAFTHGESTDSEADEDTIPLDNYSVDVPVEDNRELPKQSPLRTGSHGDPNDQTDTSIPTDGFSTPSKNQHQEIAREIGRLESLREGRILRKRTKNDPPVKRIGHIKSRCIATQHLQPIIDDPDGKSGQEEIKITSKPTMKVKDKFKVGTQVYTIDSGRDIAR